MVAITLHNLYTYYVAERILRTSHLFYLVLITLRSIDYIIRSSPLWMKKLKHREDK